MKILRVFLLFLLAFVIGCEGGLFAKKNLTPEEEALEFDQMECSSYASWSSSYRERGFNTSSTLKSFRRDEEYDRCMKKRGWQIE